MNCFCLRLGFDLFSHSFHNLIKKTLVPLRNIVVVVEKKNKKSQKKVSVYGREGGSKEG